MAESDVPNDVWMYRKLLKLLTAAIEWMLYGGSLLPMLSEIFILLVPQSTVGEERVFSIIRKMIHLDDSLNSIMRINMGMPEELMPFINESHQKIC